MNAAEFTTQADQRLETSLLNLYQCSSLQELGADLAIATPAKSTDPMRVHLVDRGC
ncbi:MAG: hypothetical protein HC910_12785 [Spirulinaceae cyanobacterium SM2_1_0]|nr:hypothetical protein [Spirulinaceae cyanobacterium SM2_1_0]